MPVFLCKSLQNANTCIFLLLLCIWQCGSTPYYCIPDTCNQIKLPPNSANSSQLSLCPHLRGEADSRVSRNCHWEIRTLGAKQLAVELVVAGRYRSELDYDAIVVKGQLFAKQLNIFSDMYMCPKADVPWNSSQHFQILPLAKNSDRVVVNLQVDTELKVNISQLFYIRVSYSSWNSCSSGLAHHGGRCYAVRNSSKLAQTELSLLNATEDLTKILLSLTDGQDATMRRQPVKIVAAYCTATHSLHYWDSDRGVCSQMKIGADYSILPGTGNYTSVSAHEKRMSPVMCSTVSPAATLFSWPAASAQNGRNSKTWVEPGHCWSRHCKDSQLNEAGASALSYIVLGLAVPTFIALIVALRYFKVKRQQANNNNATPTGQEFEDLMRSDSR